MLKGKSSFFKPGPPALLGKAHEPIIHFLRKELRGVSVMDLGGGMGAYSFELKALGYETMVADVDQNALHYAKEAGLNTRLLSFDEDLGNNVVDNVILIEVLEHVEDPLSFLNKAIIATKERVLITLPATEFFDNLFEIGLSFAHIAVSDHLHHFSLSEIQSLLSKTGYSYQIRMGDYLFPHAAYRNLKQSIKNPLLKRIGLFPLWLLHRIGVVNPSIPSRFYIVIDKNNQ